MFTLRASFDLARIACLEEEWITEEASPQTVMLDTASVRLVQHNVLHSTGTLLFLPPITTPHAVVPCPHRIKNFRDFFNADGQTCRPPKR